MKFLALLILAVSLALSFSSSSFAIGGITSTSEFEVGTEIEDMRVKVLGGYVRMTRRWDAAYGRWEWNSRWTSPQKQNYLRFRRSKTDYIYSRMDGTDMVFEDRSGNQLLLKDKWNLEGLNEHPLIWRDRQGNSIDFSWTVDAESLSYPSLQIKNYRNRNNVQVNIEYDESGQISHILDHNQNIIITYTWENDPDQKARLIKLTDFTGREVLYHYVGSLLDSVTDIRGERWKYKYKLRASGQSFDLSEQADPSGRVTKYSGQGRTLPNGNQINFTNDYDKSTKISYVAENHSSGKFIETWTDELGQVVQRKINGELEFIAEYRLSDTAKTQSDVLSFFRAHKNNDNANISYCQLIGANPVLQHITGMPPAFSSCSFLRTAGIQPELCGNSCVRNGDYYHALEQDKNNPLLPKDPPPMDPPPYVKSKVVTDARGNKTAYVYDRWGNVLLITYPDGSTIERTWLTKYSLPLTEKNQNGAITNYEYDDKGNLLTLTEAKGTDDERITRYTYDEYGQIVTKTTGESVANNTALATTHYEYDQYGNRTVIIDPMGNTTHYSDFDSLGNARAMKDARANQQSLDYRWSKTFDAAGNQLSSTDPYGKGDTYTYNQSGDLASVTEAQGATTHVETDAAGSPVTLTNAAEHVMRLEYNKAKLPVAMVDANGNKAQFFYNGAGQLIRAIDGESNTTRYDYENALLSKIHHPRFTEELTYDNRRRAVDTREQANSQTYLRKSDYDTSGNLVSSIDANNNGATYEYDKLNRPIKMIDAEGGITTLAYDARDNLREVTDPELRTTSYQYDVNDRLISETLAGGEHHYSYDAKGNLISHINPAGEKTTYDYDQADRQTKASVYASADSTQPIKVISYNINPNNQFTGYSQQAGITPEGNAVPGITPDIIPLSETYTYTALNQLETVTINFGAFSKSYSYSYYPNGLKHTYTNPEGITYAYYYNKNNQLTAVHIPDHGQLTYSNFQWLAPQTLLLPGGNNITLKYNDFLQVKERILKDPANNNVASAIYEYDLESNIKQIISEHGTYSFGYDDLYRLTQSDYPAEVAANDESFAYDGVGNRTGHTLGNAEDEALISNLSYNNKNQLTQSVIENSTATFTYNANGHTATKTENGNTTEYIYNHEERLIAVKINNQTVGEYAYNPFGMRIKKTANGQTTFYFYNDKGLAAEYSSSGNLIKEYHFHPQQTWMTDPLFQRTADNQIYYYQNDHLGTPQRMIVSNGAVVWQANYSAFGEADVTVSTIENNLRLPGQYFDAETGLHQNYFRDYDPKSGRYIQSDPIGLSGGINTFAYVEQNPIKYVDPLGLWKRPDPWDHAWRPAPANTKPPGFGPFGPVCGPAGNPKNASWIPDGIFESACQQHDECYETCGMSQSECDWKFLKNSGNLFYAGVVAAFGKPNYEAAQAENGCNDECTK